MRDSIQLRAAAVDVISAAARDFLSAQTPLLEARQVLPCALAERTIKAHQDVLPLHRLASCRQLISADVPTGGILKELEAVKNELRILEDQIDNARRTTTFVNLRVLFDEAMLCVHSARTLLDLAVRLLDQVNDQPSA